VRQVNSHNGSGGKQTFFHRIRWLRSVVHHSAEQDLAKRRYQPIKVMNSVPTSVLVAATSHTCRFNRSCSVQRAAISGQANEDGETWNN
jgi:hypothetical protein